MLRFCIYIRQTQKTKSSRWESTLFSTVTFNFEGDLHVLGETTEGIAVGGLASRHQRGIESLAALENGGLWEWVW